jgi:hypothetical protein
MMDVNGAVLELEMWFRGDLEFLTYTRPHGQHSLYKFLTEYKAKNPLLNLPIVFNCHRRLGKSTLLLTILTERCLRYPGTFAKFGAPFYNEVNRIARPLLAQILRTCPPSLRPKKNKDTYTFYNPRWPQGSEPSQLELLGCNIDNGDRLRGVAADIVALDEVRDIPNLSYIVEEILSYQFVGRSMPTILLASTPPQSMAHEFVTKFIKNANNDGTYKVIPASRNPDFTKQDEQIILDIVKSKDSVGWRREAECLLEDDPESLVVPYFSIKNVETFEPIEHFFPLTCVDFGYFPDYTAVLTGYVDYRQQKLFIVDEWIDRMRSTGEVMKAAKALEQRWFKNNPKQVMRFGDNSKQQLQDLAVDHNFYVDETDKYDKERWIAELNFNFQQLKVIIHPRCEKLINQCSHAIYDKNKKIHKDYVRNEELGHCDGLATLVYLNRMAPWRANPYPEMVHNKDNQFRDPFIEEADKNKMAEIFKPAAVRHPKTILVGNESHEELLRKARAEYGIKE